MDPDLGKIYTWREKAYREKVSKDVNTNHSIEDILDYVANYPPHRCSPKREVAAEVPFQSIGGFVNTMRQSSSSGDGAFLWPSERFGIMRAIAVTLHHLPVGHMMSIKNAQMIP